jgi:hypothetical protein
MVIFPRAGLTRMIRHKYEWSNSSVDGALNE